MSLPSSTPAPQSTKAPASVRATPRVRRIAALAACWFLAASLASAAGPPASRPASWAQPITMAGVPNLHRISASLYRSAQPDPEGMQHLKQLGITTVVSLRSFHSDREVIGRTGLGYESIPMKAWHPEREDVVRFLQAATDPKRTPVLVHCQHGADRTGTLCAVYRIAVQNWTKEAAIREMTGGNFGFHEIWGNLPRWIEKLDIESLRKEIGISPKKENGNRRRSAAGDPALRGGQEAAGNAVLIRD